MIYVFAPNVRRATQWYRDQGLRPRDVRAFGSWESSVRGTRFRPGDRVVVLGDLHPEVRTALDGLLRQYTAGGITVERWPAAPVKVDSR